VREHERAVLLIEVLVEAQPPGAARAEQAGECRLAHSQRVAPQVVAVQLDQVKGIEEHARVVVPVADALEARDAVLAARDCLAVDDARARGERLDDERETVG